MDQITTDWSISISTTGIQHYIHRDWKERKKITRHEITPYFTPLLLDKQKQCNETLFIFSLSRYLRQPWHCHIIDSFNRLKLLQPNININADNFMTYYPNITDYFNKLDALQITSPIFPIPFSQIIKHFIHRYCQRMNATIYPSIKNQYEINDNLMVYISYAKSLNKYLHSLIREHSLDDNPNIFPLHLDVWIIPRSYSKVEQQKMDDDNSDDTDDTDDTDQIDNSDDNNSNSSPKQSTHIRIADNIPKLLRKRKKNKNIIIQSSLNDNDDMERAETSLFKFLKNNENFLRGSRKQRRRKILIIDRRRLQCKHDIFYLYDAPKIYGEIPRDLIEYYPDIHVCNSMKYMLPLEDHKNYFTLGTKDPNSFFLSYQLLSSDCIKEYWGIFGNIVRFFNNDMFQIWPKYFNSNDYDIQKLHRLQTETNINDFCDTKFYEFFKQFIGQSMNDSFYNPINHDIIRAFNANDNDNNNNMQLGRKHNGTPHNVHKP